MLPAIEFENTSEVFNIIWNIKQKVNKRLK